MLDRIERHFHDHVTLEWLQSVRREFHARPEVSGEEYETMRRIADFLDSWGVEYKAPVADTGVTAILRGKRPGKTIALRADIDALPIQERNEAIDYASKHPGIMHACGHDVHTTVLLGTIKLLHSLEGEFSGNVKCFFQPAEEKGGGARRMMEEGVLEDPHVDAVLGLHVMPDHPAGTVGIRYGQMYASSDTFEVKVIGKSTHGAIPEAGIDAIVVAAQIITAVQTIVSRTISPLHSAVISFGIIRGGNAGNQIAEEVTMTGNFRALHSQIRKDIQERFRRICEQTAEAMGARAVVEIREGYAPMVNDDVITRAVHQHAVELLGEDNVLILPQPKMVSEDFSFFAAERPAAFYHLGCGYDDRENPPLHNSCFDVNEECMEVGVRLQALHVLRFLE